MVWWHRTHLKNPQSQSSIQVLQYNSECLLIFLIPKMSTFFSQTFQHICLIVLKGFPGRYYFITPRKLHKPKFLKWKVSCRSLRRVNFLKKYDKWMSENFQMSGEVKIPNRIETYLIGSENFWSASNKSMHLKENKIRPWNYVYSYITHLSTSKVQAI